MRSKDSPQCTRKETLTAFGGSQPGQLFLVELGSGHLIKNSTLNNWYHHHMSIEKNFKLKDAFMHCF